MRDAWGAGRSSAGLPVILAIIGLLLCSFFSPAQAKTEEEWKERTVYQIVSDICARSTSPSS
jgi:hypothetical protein